jgi:hypothetical protein
MTLCREYIPYLEEIKQLCLDKTGRLPFVLYGLDAKNSWKRYDFFTPEFIDKISTMFDCKHLLLEDKYTNDIKRKEFCYMGDFGFIYNLETGYISACFDSPTTQNICKDISKPIKFQAVGKCYSKYCAFGCRLFCFGVLPELSVFPTYTMLLEKNKAPVGEVGEWTDNCLYQTNKTRSLKAFFWKIFAFVKN